MMKSVTLTIGLACLLAITIIGAAQAAGDETLSFRNSRSPLGAGHFGKEWGVVLGVKAWYNEWDVPIELNATNKTFILEYESDAEISYIPACLVRYHNFFIGGSYLLETDYNFTAQQYETFWTDNNNELITSTRNLTVSGSRKERDLNIGYFITPNIAISLGYKDIERKLAMRNSWAGDESYYSISSYPLSAHAPILGISASVPVGGRFNFYGNFAYGWLSGDAKYNFINAQNVLDSNELDLDGNYIFAELGFNYLIPLQQNIASAVTLNFGYRFQRLDMKFDNDAEWGSSGDQHDATAGFVLGASALF